jgi:putative methyltransferase (TIGR04325 family)
LKEILKRIAVATLPDSAVARLRRIYRNQMAPETVQVPTPSGESETKLEWEMMPNMDEVWQAPAGWSHQSIADRQIAGWDDFLAGLDSRRPIGVPTKMRPEENIDVTVHNAVMIFAYFLGRVRADSRSQTPSVLDWGGGIGQYYRYAKAFYPDVPWDFSVKEVAELAEAGRARNPGATFFSDDAMALSRRYDGVCASGSIMYDRDVHRLIGKLCYAAEHYLLVTRTPFLDVSDDFVVVQRPYRYGYMTEYAGWFLNRERFIRTVEGHGFVLDREFPLAERPYVPNAPEQCRYRGFLFRRRDA